MDERAETTILRDRLRESTTARRERRLGSGKAHEARLKQYMTALFQRGARLLSGGYHEGRREYYVTCEVDSPVYGALRPTISRPTHEALLGILESKVMFRREIEAIEVARKSYDLGIDALLGRYRHDLAEATQGYGAHLNRMICTGSPLAISGLPQVVRDAQDKARASYVAYREALRELDTFKASLAGE